MALKLDRRTFLKLYYIQNATGDNGAISGVAAA